MHGLRLDQTPKVLFTCTNIHGETVALVVRHQLSDLPFWFCHNPALFNRQTPDEVRKDLFNAVLDANDKDRPDGTVYADKVALRKGFRGAAFFHIHLTDQGAALVRSTGISSNVTEIAASDIATPSKVRQLNDAARFAIKNVL